MTQQKDPLISFKSVGKKIKENGDLSLTLRMTGEEVENLLNQLPGLVTERGAKFSVHVRKKQTNDGSRTFDSAFMFISGIQEPSSFAPKTKTYAPKAADVLNKRVG